MSGRDETGLFSPNLANRAVASGTQLRLVVGSDIVRRMLVLSGLDRLIPVYPSLEGATVAGAGRQKVQEEPTLAPIASAAARPAGVPAAATADDAGCPRELLDSVVNSIFQVGMILQAATGLSPGLTTEHISEALRRLDDVMRMVRDHLFTEHEHLAGQGLPPSSQQSMEERLARAAKHTALLCERVVQTAYAVQPHHRR